MARISRKQRDAAPTSRSGEVEAFKVYTTALYLRLSIMDTRDRPDSESLANQQSMLEDYAARHPELEVVRVFTDNGETGTDFQRPAWMELIDECRNGRIDCIVVKDLSRLGRNYLESGEYLEMILPALGVRFIAVNDNYDSLNVTESNRLAFSLKNLVNDVYAKDISRKSSSALRQKQKNGAFIGSYAAYGYIKTPGDKNSIVVDSETAPVVRQIFQWKAEGVSYTQICRRLNDADIPSPCKYRLEKGILKDQRYEKAVWAPATIKSILRNPVYLGHMTQGKHGGALYEGLGRKRLPPSEWVIVENTHEPIIERKLFDRVQQSLAELAADYQRKQGKYAHFEKPDNIFKGMARCADCGRPLYRYKSVTSNGKYVSWIFLCRTHEVYGDAECPKKYIHEDALAQAVRCALVAEVSKAANIEKVIAKLNRGTQHQKSVKDNADEIGGLQARLQRVNGLRKSVYEDYATGLLTVRDYKFAAEKYDVEVLSLEQRIATAEEMREYLTQTCTPSNKYLTAFRDISNKQEVSRELLATLVNSITVYANNRVEITWNFRDENEVLMRYMDSDEKVVSL